MKQFIKRHRYIIALTLLVITISLLGLLINWDFGGVLSSRESLQSFIESFGAWGPLILILIIAIEVIIAPIPGFIPALTAGLIFGPFWGALYVYIGSILGTLAVFYLVKWYGRPFAKRFIKERKLDKYEEAIEKHENWLLAFYFIPVLPLDVITAAFGLSAIKPKKFITIILIGYLVYSVVLAAFGDVLAEFFFNIF